MTGASLRDRALTANELLALKAWAGTCTDFDYISFADVARDSGLPKHLVRRTVRAMSRKGVTRFASGLSNDDGDFKGSGYGLTSLGRDLLCKHYERECECEEAYW